MRIWDIHPGYLNRQSLLGEHRELHGIVSILINSKKGYANHPETKRWENYGWALQQRHKFLVSEMRLRGYADRSPVGAKANKGNWPQLYIDKPHIQLQRLKEKYSTKKQGRIPLPKNTQELWSHHKYSVLARDPNRYKEIGPDIAAGLIEFDKLAVEMVKLLRIPPDQGGLRNAVQHMWGHVSIAYEGNCSDCDSWSTEKLLLLTQKNTLKIEEPYLLSSTALSELMVWL